MNHFLIVAAGGAVGAAARHGVGVLVMRAGLSGWPWATFAVNLVGSLLMGLLVGWLAFRGETLGGGQATRLFLATGVLGGFTTFSAFSLEIGQYIQRGDWWRAGSYAGLSVLLGVAGLLAGLMVMKKVLG